MCFFGEVKERPSGVRVVGYKALIEICEPQEGSYILDCQGNGLVSDSCHFDWVHGQGSGLYYHPKVFDLRDAE